MVGLAGYIAVSALLFAIGMVGFLTRRNLIIMFLSTEIMLQGVLLNLVAFSRLHGQVDGQVFGLFVIVAAAVEAAIGLGLIVLLFRRRGSLDTEELATMSG